MDINLVKTLESISPLKITSASIAEFIGVSENTVSKWKAGGEIRKSHKAKLIELFEKYNIEVKND